MKYPLSHSRTAFTLVELMVSMVILVLILLVLVQGVDAVRRSSAQTTGKIEQFREARESFETLTRRISQATLNPYWDYDNATTPKTYLRKSDLRFISGPATDLKLPTNPVRPGHAIFFQAPFGYTENSKYAYMKTLLNTCGFYVEWGSDKDSRPAFINTMTNAPALQYRFRLMEMMEPTESLTIYKNTSGATPGGVPKNDSYKARDWFTTPLAFVKPDSTTYSHALAKNIVLLHLAPRSLQVPDSLASNYFYSSVGEAPITDPTVQALQKNQLPPVIRVKMIAVDEVTFARYQTLRGNAGTTAPTWYTGLFHDVSQEDADFATFRKTLQDNKINYREFTSDVSIRSAKWSP